MKKEDSKILVNAKLGQNQGKKLIVVEHFSNFQKVVAGQLNQNIKKYFQKICILP